MSGCRTGGFPIWFRVNGRGVGQRRHYPISYIFSSLNRRSSKPLLPSQGTFQCMELALGCHMHLRSGAEGWFEVIQGHLPSHNAPHISGFCQHSANIAPPPPPPSTATPFQGLAWLVKWYVLAGRPWGLEKKAAGLHMPCCSVGIPMYPKP